MTIDREKLIQLLVSKTGFERERVETQLTELINRIQKAAREGKSFEIEGFGIFTINDDELNFEPSDELETEVNHKYAGMEPIELIGAYEEADQEQEEPDTEEADAVEEPAGETEEKGEEELASEPETVADEEPDTEEPDDEDAVWGIDDSSALSEEISKARTEKEEEQESAGDWEEEEAEQTGTTKEDIEEVLDSLDDESEFEEEVPEPEFESAEEIEGPEEPVELEEIEKMLAGEDESEEVAAAGAAGPDSETEPPKAKKARWEPGNELRDAPPEEPEPGPGPKTKKKKKDPIGSILVVFLVLIVVGVGGWFAYDTGLVSGIISTVTGGSDREVTTTTGPQSQSPVQSQQQQQNVPQQSEPDAQPSPTATQQQQQQQQQQQAADPVADTDNNQQQQDEQPAEPDTENEVATGGTETEAGRPLFGLKGEVNPDANTGYTIVVYSLQNETRARRLQNNLSEEGYRAVLTEATVNGNTYWRVGLGQFETVNAAQSAAGNLREPFRNNFFIKRIE